MPTKLEEIVAATRGSIAGSKAAADLRALREAAERHQPRGFRAALKKKSAAGAAVIAELKKASPSKGLIRADFPVAELATELEAAGATALSVLTDEHYFQGSLRNLELASSATQLPCLRKDFIVDDFQVLQARAYGADAILLIVAALSDEELTSLRSRAGELQLDVLCEVHDGEEMWRAVDAGFDLIGVNNRNLHSFQVDLNTSLQLASRMPAGVVKVAESGIETRDDIARAAAGWIRCLPDRRIADARPATGRSLARVADAIGGSGLMTRQQSIWVKVCGTTSLHDARLSVAAGANALGFIFAPSPRRVEVSEAAGIVVALADEVESIGVFVNESPTTVAEVASRVGLTGVQLHGDEAASQMAEFRRTLGQRKIIKTLTVSNLQSNHTFAT